MPVPIFSIVKPCPSRYFRLLSHFGPCRVHVHSRAHVRVELRLFGSGLCPPGARARAGARPVFSIVKAFRVRPTKMFELSDFPMLLHRLSWSGRQKCVSLAISQCYFTDCRGAKSFRGSELHDLTHGRSCYGNSV